MTHKHRAALWAHNLMRNRKFVIVDTETTGTDNNSQICQMGWCSPANSEECQILVKPTIPISPEATAIHRITDDLVEHAPYFEEVFIDLLKYVGDRDVIFYNADFDLRLLRQSARARGFQLAFPTSDRRQCRVFTNGGSIHCAMLRYAEWVGEWDFYHSDYHWHPLPGGDHTALGDCKATLTMMELLASSYIAESENPQTPYDAIPF